MVLVAQDEIFFYTWDQIGVPDFSKGTQLFATVRLIAFALMASIASASHAQVIPSDEAGFTEHVAALLKKETGGDVSVKGPLTLGVGPLQANLDRVFDYCKKNGTACANELNTYVKAAAQVYRNMNVPPVREAVRIAVRSAQYLQQAQRALPADAPALQSRPLVQDLAEVLVLDSPQTIRMLTEKDNQALGITSEQAHQLAMANTLAALKPLMETAKVAGRGKIGQLVGDFQSSRLAFHDAWAPLAEAQGGKLIVSAPVTDAMFYIGEDSPAAIDALRSLVRNIMSRAPNRLSDTLLRWTQSGWEVVR